MKMIVFDLDGTLVNTVFDIAVAMNKSLTFYGYKTNTVEDYISFLGQGALVLTKKAMNDPNASSELVQEVLNRYNDYYAMAATTYSKPYDNIIEVLETLKNRGYLLGVISNKPDRETQIIVNHFFPNIFDYVTGAKPEVKRKPDPESMHILMKKFDLELKDITYVGDSHFDAMFSENSMCDYFLFEYGYDKTEVIHEYHPKAFLNEKKDLLKYFN